MHNVWKAGSAKRPEHKLQVANNTCYRLIRGNYFDSTSTRCATAANTESRRVKLICQRRAERETYTRAFVKLKIEQKVEQLTGFKLEELIRRMIEVIPKTSDTGVPHKSCHRQPPESFAETKMEAENANKHPLTDRQLKWIFPTLPFDVMRSARWTCVMD